ncbi:MAG: hypothetical protein O3B37_08855 [Proteobacteria bacterium]|nr:hypothetical protein [Pseudomonadota bacterium]
MTDSLARLFAWPAESWLPALILLIALTVIVFRGHTHIRSTPVILFVACLAGALLPLLGFWLVGRTHPNAIAGLLPWNDAAGYYGCALLILDGENITPFCQRRPVYSLYLAGLLNAGGGSLQMALVLQTILNGAAIFGGALFVAWRWGTAAAFVAAAILSAYVAIFSVTTLTENLGFVLGTAGLLLIFVGAERSRHPVIGAGVFLLSAALNARAGAFFVLPLLLVWPFLETGLSPGRRARAAAYISIGAAAGFVPGTIAASLLGEGVGEIHSNFAYILYGIAAGGERWVYTLQQLPGASTEEISAAAWELIRTQPHLFALGLFQGFLEYIQRLLTYIPWLPARVVLALFWLWGLAALFVRRTDNLHRILALTMVGIAASSPFMSIDGDTRVYASTMVIDGILAALGFRHLASMSSRRSAIWAGGALAALVIAVAMVPGDLRAWGLALLVGGALAWLGQRAGNVPLPHMPPTRADWGVPAGLAAIALLFTIPLSLIPTGSTPGVGVAAAVSACGEEFPLVIRPGHGSPVVRIVPRSGIWPVSVPAAAFRAGSHPLTHGYDELAALPDGTAIVYAFDLLKAGSGRTSVLLGDARQLPMDGRRYLVCVTKVENSPSLEARRITAVHPID